MDTKQTQISVRLPAHLYTAFRERLLHQRGNMNSVIRGLLEEWLAGADNQTARERSGVPATHTSPGPIDGNHSDVAPTESESLLRAYARCIPAVILVKELHGRVICANKRFTELVGKPDVIGQLPSDYLENPTAELIEAQDKQVRESGLAFLCAERLEIRDVVRRRLTLRFPIFERRELKYTGALGFDVDELIWKATTLAPSAGASPRNCKLSHRSDPHWLHSAFNSESLLEAFIESVPAIATVKDLEGRLLCANKEYTRVTGKRLSDVKGRLPSENWPEASAHLIMVHDQLVRETRCPFMSVDTIVVAARSIDRLNIRFPVLDARGVLAMTGSFGFDHGLLLKALRMFEESSERPIACLPLDGMAAM